MISRTTVFLLMIFSLSFNVGCQSAGKRTGVGAAAGAVVGGVVGAAKGGVKGAAIGAAAGGAAGAGIGYYLDQRAKELSKVVETKKTDDGLMVTLKNDVLFDFNKTDISADARKTLGELAAILKKYPGDKLRITGFTDKVGTTDYNQRLSQKRAEAVQTQLTANGVEQARVKAVGVGETRAKGTETEPRAEDRKVEIYIDVEQPKQT
jgi:outer membrane protein OmpA-like peptidoglycan-associated protein